MTLKRRSGGSWTDIATTLKRKESGSWVDLDVIKRRLSGAWTTTWKRLTINNQSVYSFVSVPATTGYRLNTSGVAESRDQAYYTPLETWLSSGTSSNYESRCTVNSGTLAGGTANTWESLGTSREWFIQQATVGTSTASLTIEIRRASGPVITSATITLEAERF